MPTTLPTTKSRTNLHRLTSKPQLHRRTTPTKTATKKSHPFISHSHHASKDSSSTPASPDVHAIDYKDDSDFFGVSFQQYCSVCDKLIPSNATLYCSSACRQKDSQTTNSLPIFRTDITPPMSPSAASFYGVEEAPVVKDIVAQRSPGIRPRYASSSSYYSHDRSGSDPDVLGQERMSQSLRRSSRGESSPFTSLSAQLGASLPASSISPLHQQAQAHGRTPSTTSLSGQLMAMPSLSQTTTPTQALLASSGPYTPTDTLVTRRPNPRWSSTSFGARSVDLVMPISAGYTVDAEDGEDSEEEGAPRRGSSGKMESGKGALREMFRFERMRGDAGTPGVR